MTSALFASSRPTYKFVTPVMGLGILVGIATFLARFLTADEH